MKCERVALLLGGQRDALAKAPKNGLEKMTDSACGREHADGVRLALGEHPRDRVRAVAERIRDVADPARGLGRQPVGAVERERHRRLRHARLAGDVGDARPAPGPLLHGLLGAVVHRPRCVGGRSGVERTRRSHRAGSRSVGSVKTGLANRFSGRLRGGRPPVSSTLRAVADAVAAGRSGSAVPAGVGYACIARCSTSSARCPAASASSSATRSSSWPASGCRLRWVVDQAISAPVCPSGVVVDGPARLHDLHHDARAPAQGGVAGLALGLASLTMPASRCCCSPAQPIEALFVAALAALLFLGLTRPEVRTWLERAVSARLRTARRAHPAGTLPFARSGIRGRGPAERRRSTTAIADGSTWSTDRRPKPETDRRRPAARRGASHRPSRPSREPVARARPARRAPAGARRRAAATTSRRSSSATARRSLAIVGRRGRGRRRRVRVHVGVAAAYACTTIDTVADRRVAGELGQVQPDMGNHARQRAATRSPTRSARPPPASTSTSRRAARSRARVYGPDDAAVPNGWVHNLEHGGLVLLYSCDKGACDDASLAAAAARSSTGFPPSPICQHPAGRDRPGHRPVRPDADQVRGARLGPRAATWTTLDIAADLRLLPALRRAARQRRQLARAAGAAVRGAVAERAGRREPVGPSASPRPAEPDAASPSAPAASPSAAPSPSAS